jgi:hypothetical protein
MSSPTAFVCNNNNCFYDSECLATSAGWNVAKDCEKVPLVSESIGYEYDSKGCPITGPAWSCMYLIDPVVCTSDEAGSPKCEYGNECLAEGAGWVPTSDCKPKQTTAAATKACPAVVGGCSKEYSPRKCSKGPYVDCKYNNLCLARKAGFVPWKDCVFVPFN